MKGYLARNKNGHLSLFQYRPTLEEDFWFGGESDGEELYVNESLLYGEFREVTFENSPVEVEINIRQKQKMKYKVGDKVRVMSLEQYNRMKNEGGAIPPCKLGNKLAFLRLHSKFCGKEAVITSVDEENEMYKIDADKYLAWTDEMFV